MGLGSTTEPLRAELAAALPQRPFALRFWDGSALASTSGNGPVFSARSPRAVAHALLAPGQLGLARAYVSGELEIDDLDAVLALLRDWTAPPPLSTTGRGSSASLCQRRRPRWRASGRRRRGSPTASRSGWPTTATCAASASTRSPALAWWSTSAPCSSISTPRGSRACSNRGGAYSTTA